MIGAVVIVVGLYLVLWGKSKDNPPPKLIEQVLVPTIEEHVTTKNGTPKIQNQELVAIEVEDPKMNLSEGTKHSMT